MRPRDALSPRQSHRRRERTAGCEWTRQSPKESAYIISGTPRRAAGSFLKEVAMSRILIASLACAASMVWAEGNSNTVKGQPGFFQPTPDGNSSLTRIVPPPEPPQQVVVSLDRDTERDRRREELMDRNERENRDAADRARRSTIARPAPGSYFSGNLLSPNVFDR